MRAFKAALKERRDLTPPVAFILNFYPVFDFAEKKESALLCFLHSISFSANINFRRRRFVAVSAEGCCTGCRKRRVLSFFLPVPRMAGASSQQPCEQRMLRLLIL